MTPTEERILELMRHGMTNREIAEELARSISTIKIHVEHILKKSGARNRTQACAGFASRAMSGDVKNRPDDR